MVSTAACFMITVSARIILNLTRHAAVVYYPSMDTQITQKPQLYKKRQLAAQRLAQWRKRNSQHLAGWDPVAVLREWREKRWSSSTHQ